MKSGKFPLHYQQLICSGIITELPSLGCLHFRIQQANFILQVCTHFPLPQKSILGNKPVVYEALLIGKDLNITCLLFEAILQELSGSW